MKHQKKSAVGPVEVYQQLNGESNKTSNGISVNPVVFISPQRIILCADQISLYGLRNG